MSKAMWITEDLYGIHNLGSDLNLFKDDAESIFKAVRKRFKSFKTLADSPDDFNMIGNKLFLFSATCVGGRAWFCLEERADEEMTSDKQKLAETHFSLYREFIEDLLLDSFGVIELAE